MPLGAPSARRVDVRVVAATNRDLRAESTAGQFRRDLFYRLRVFPIALPPLRERPEDVAPLAEHFLARFAREEAKPIAGFAPETLAAMERFAWPGNVRDLENEVHRLVVAATPGMLIRPEELSDAIRHADPAASAAPGGPLRDIVRQLETAVIQSRLREHDYHRNRTAESLGLSRESLWAKMRMLGILPRKKGGSP